MNVKDQKQKIKSCLEQVKNISEELEKDCEYPLVNFTLQRILDCENDIKEILKLTNLKEVKNAE